MAASRAAQLTQYQGVIDAINSLRTEIGSLQTARVGIEVAIADENLDAVIEAISKAANTGKVGDGKIFVSTLDDVIRIRTGETGAEAV